MEAVPDEFDTQVELLREAKKCKREAEAEIAKAEATQAEATRVLKEAQQKLDVARQQIRSILADLAESEGEEVLEEAPKMPGSPPPPPNFHKSRQIVGDSGSTRYDAVFDLLVKSEGRPLRCADITEGIGLNKGLKTDYHNVYNTLKTLEKSKYAKQDGEKAWTITPEGLAANNSATR